MANAKAHKPYEFGVKVSVATPIQRCKGGQFVAHVAALPGNPYDGHTVIRYEVHRVWEITRAANEPGELMHCSTALPNMSNYTPQAVAAQGVQ